MQLHSFSKSCLLVLSLGVLALDASIAIGALFAFHAIFTIVLSHSNAKNWYNEKFFSPSSTHCNACCNAMAIDCSSPPCWQNRQLDRSQLASIVRSRTTEYRRTVALPQPRSLSVFSLRTCTSYIAIALALCELITSSITEELLQSCMRVLSRCSLALLQCYLHFCNQGLLCCVRWSSPMPSSSRLF